MIDSDDCFERAVTVAVEAMAEVDPETVVICHGRPRYRGEGELEAPDGRFWHAWVEVADTVEIPIEGFPGATVTAGVQKVIDRSNNVDYEGSKGLYYAVGDIRADDVLRFTIPEAMEAMRNYEHYGPWVENWEEAGHG